MYCFGLQSFESLIHYCLSNIGVQNISTYRYRVYSIGFDLGHSVLCCCFIAGICNSHLARVNWTSILKLCAYIPCTSSKHTPLAPRSANNSAIEAPIPTDKCISLQNTLPTSSSTGYWCSWFTPSSIDPQPCSKGTLSKPLSWAVVGGTCTVLGNAACTEDSASHAYSNSNGCYNYGTTKFDPQNWTSVSCGSYDNGVGAFAAKKPASKITAASKPQVT